MASRQLDESRNTLQSALDECVHTTTSRAPASRVAALPPPMGLWRGARKPAVSALVLGLVMVAVNVWTIASSGVFGPRALAAGVTAVGMGGLMWLFPGRVELPAFTTRQVPLGLVWSGMDPSERSGWMLGLPAVMVLAVGIALGL